MKVTTTVTIKMKALDFNEGCVRKMTVIINYVSYGSYSCELENSVTQTDDNICMNINCNFDASLAFTCIISEESLLYLFLKMWNVKTLLIVVEVVVEVFMALC